MELEQVIESVAGLAGEVVDAQLLTRDEHGNPLAQLSGLLTIDSALAAEGPLVLGVGQDTIWIWPDRFVEANPIATRGALELVTQDVILIVGPGVGDWID